MLRFGKCLFCRNWRVNFEDRFSVAQIGTFDVTIKLDKDQAEFKPSYIVIVMTALKLIIIEHWQCITSKWLKPHAWIQIVIRKSRMMNAMRKFISIHFSGWKTCNIYENSSQKIKLFNLALASLKGIKSYSQLGNEFLSRDI